MLKRSLSLLALLICMIPMTAFAGTLTARVMTTGGYLTVNSGAQQTSANGTKYYSGLSGTASVAFAGNVAGYTVSAVKLDGVTQPLTSPLSVNMSANHTVTVSFAKQQVTVTSSATTTDGTVSPYGANTIYAGTPVTYTFTPNAGKQVEAITVTGATATLDHDLPYAGQVKATFTPLGNVTVVGAFVSLSANAGAPQTIVINNGAAAATLTGTASSTDGTSYAWTQTAGPAAQIVDPTSPSTAVNFSATGVYSFKLTATNGAVATATTTVTVAATANDAALNACVNCHNSGNIAATVYPAWSASAHEAKNVLCANCHTGADTGAHPGVATSSIKCENCHSPVASTFQGSLHWTSPTGNGDAAYFTAAGHGSVASCAQKCHFNQGAETGCAVCHVSGALGASTSSATAGVISAATDRHAVVMATTEACFSCHSGSKHGGPTTGFQLSAHWTNTINDGSRGASCQNSCHFRPDPASGNLKTGCAACHDAHKPESIVAATICWSCHQSGSHHDPTTTQPNHLGVTDCTACHNPHTLVTGLPHTNYTSSMTNASYRASYVTPRTQCTFCHANAGVVDTFQTQRQEWAASGHGDINAAPWKASSSHDWKNSNECVRCHTSAGFARYVASGFTVYSSMHDTDKESEPLTCNACHVDNTFAVRTVGAYTATYAYKVATTGDANATFNYPAVGQSGVCIPCHANRQSGQNIKNAVAAGANFTNLGFLNPHYNGGAATVYGATGYKYLADDQYVATQAKKHTDIGAGTTGPCVGCHMETANHKFEVKAVDACKECHGTGMNAEVIEANKAQFNSIKLALQAQLSSSKGIKYNPAVYGYFFAAKAGGTQIKNWGNAGTFGAAFNLHLLDHDPGAFAHNPTYAKMLLRDSIDFIANGNVDRSRDLGATIAALVGVSAADKANAIAGTSETGHPSDLNTCNLCHSTQASAGDADCVGCHAVTQNAGSTYVQDNGGVRAIIPEFTTKRSHHILNANGAAPTNAQCAVCHLEGKVVSGVIRVDTNYHMKDAKIYLRDVDHAGQAFAWDGTNHTDMDNFCFACHDDNGAADTATLTALLPAATANNPFADTLTNGYDQVTRAGVVDVKTAFTTTNASHHAVSGQRYKYRFSTQANADAWAARPENAGKPAPTTAEIAEYHVGDASPNGGTIEAFDEAETMPTTLTGTSEGDATLFEMGKFVAGYTPLGASESVGDNSTLHCGDCHTVGQWKNDNTTYNKAAIGAHGSNNEYMLRNNTGNDELHNNLTYVCFNCHVGGIKAGATHPTTAKTNIIGYATAHAVSAFHIQCLADSADNIGATDRLAKSWEGDKVKTLDYAPYAGTATAPAGGSDATSGNITGISCTSCHNSALRKGFGGIHGGDNTYTDGLGRVQKSYRFMPGMGNYRYAPPGGWDGKDVSDSRFVTVGGNAAGIPGGKPMGGCYTNNTATENAGYSACSHHGTSTTGPGNGGYWGGTAGVGNGSGTNGGDDTPGTMKADRSGNLAPTSSKENPSWEPTLREATAGNALVTRPLQY